MWGSLESFQQRNITITQRCSSKYTANLDHLVSYVTSNSGAAFAFAKSKKLTHSLLTSLERKLDKEGVDVDVVYLHGSLTEEEKTGFMEIFTGAVYVEGYNGRILMATAAADLGVDHRECEFVLIFEWPDSISTFKQQIARKYPDGRYLTTLHVTGLSLLIALAERIYHQGDALLDELDKNKNNNIIPDSTTRSTSNKNNTTKHYSSS